MGGDSGVNGRAPARRGRPHNGEMDVRWDKILDAASATFLRDGFAKTTIAKISRLVGVSTKTIYGRYANKADLMMDVVKRLTNASRIRLSKISLDKKADLATLLHEFGISVSSHWCSTTELGLFRLTISEGPRVPALYSVLEEIVAEFRDPLAVLIRARIETGEIAQKDPAFLAMTFLYLCAGDLRERALLGQAIKASEIEQQVCFSVETFLRAFCSKKGSRFGKDENVTSRSSCRRR
jgi:AcrR family transcriptional regulator